MTATSTKMSWDATSLSVMDTDSGLFLLVVKYSDCSNDTATPVIYTLTVQVHM